MKKTITLDLHYLLQFLRSIDDAQYEMYSVLKQKRYLKMPHTKIDKYDEIHSNGFATIFLESMDCKNIDLEYFIAHSLGMPEYNEDDISNYEYIDLIFLAYYNDEIDEDELIRAIEICAQDPSYKDNQLFIKAIGGWQNLDLSQ
ncbi:MAG: hypothetical protein ABF651_10740 [Sporolactobacillus sp.]